jgi:kynurenine formamidase
VNGVPRVRIDGAHEHLWASLRNATTYDLAQPFEVGMPQSPNHPEFQMALVRRHGDVVRPDGGSAANELIVTGCHVGTHIDALCHVSQDGLLYEGVPAADVTSNRGFSVHGADQIPPFVGRGVFLDIARLRGADVLGPGEAVTAADLDAACAAADLEVNNGDAVLIGTGWSTLWGNTRAYEGQDGGAPGPDESAARWIADRHVAMVGAETIAFEQIVPGAGHRTLPVHRILLVEHGINIIETMRLHELATNGVTEFLFVLTPLKLVGATGSPVRPLAVVIG